VALNTINQTNTVRKTDDLLDQVRAEQLSDVLLQIKYVLLVTVKCQEN
jgi:hypothetical protein